MITSPGILRESRTEFAWALAGSFTAASTIVSRFCAGASQLIIKLNDNKQQTIDVIMLLQEGFHYSEIEEIINETLSELNVSINKVDFLLDVEAIADAVQPETNRILDGL